MVNAIEKIFSAGSRLFVAVAGAMCLLTLAAARGEDSAGNSKPYRFKGGETVKISIPAAVGETLTEVLREDCVVSLHNGANLSIKGKTVPEAQKLITNELADKTSLQQFSAVLLIMDMPLRRIYINGEVRSPQALTLPTGMELSLSAAMTLAGGPGPAADLSSINIVSQTPDGTRQAHILDASKYGAPGNSDVGPVLDDGDIVTVPRGDVFTIAGEVVKPGVLTRADLLVNAGVPVRASRVLNLSGGLKVGANRRDIRVVRFERTGAQRVLRVDLDAANQNSASAPGALANKENDPDPILANGDLIVVGGSAGSVILMGRVKVPGVYPIVGGVTLGQLIAQAGGFGEFAKSSAVTLTHAASPRTQIRVDVNAIYKDGDREKDVELINGDIVFVDGKML